MAAGKRKGVWPENLFPNLRGEEREREPMRQKRKSEMGKHLEPMLAWKPQGCAAFPGKNNRQTREKSHLDIKTESPLDGAIRGPLNPHGTQGGQRKMRGGGKAGSTAACPGSLESWGESARVMIWVREDF